ncbi:MULTISPECIES: hypothetical protein [unclassified Aeromicrobium]|jgi:hypothetical protein|uniref:hypothetical protein n=1 Tax=unclassified Aeromicrobium TaxID=2633570 RepID=UPI000ABD1598|nr:MULTISPECIES: hypothetical protein [unclassified Aeromicrobium]
MSDPGTVRVLHPVPWSEQPQWVALRRLVFYRSLLALPFLFQFVVQRGDRPVLALLLLSAAGLIASGTAWEWWQGTRERLVLTDDTVEPVRGRRRRPRSRLARKDLWAARFSLYRGEPEPGTQALAMSDGGDGILLTHAGWTPRYPELLTILGVSAPGVSSKVAARRHPEAFGWATPHQLASAVLAVVGLVAIVVALALL